MERAEWDRVMQTIQEHGLNHLRFHSWCPPQACFAAADAAGVLIQAEAPLWTEIGTWDDTRRFLWDETERILTSLCQPCFIHQHGPRQRARWTGSQFGTA